MEYEKFWNTDKLEDVNEKVTSSCTTTVRIDLILNALSFFLLQNVNLEFWENWEPWCSFRRLETKCGWITRWWAIMGPFCFWIYAFFLSYYGWSVKQNLIFWNNIRKEVEFFWRGRWGLRFYLAILLKRHVIIISASKFYLSATKDSIVFTLAKASFLIEAINIHAVATRLLHGLELF